MLFSVTSFNEILVLAAVAPAIFLLVKVYKSDRLDKEPTKLLLQLVLFGALSTIPAMIIELVGGAVLSSVMAEGTLFSIIENFVIVGIAEEACKFFFLKKKTWKSREFDCKYDGVVYAVFVSLGFALLENIFYVLEYGLANAFVRAVTAIPGHASFGIFMGVFYGLAKKNYNLGREAASKHCLRLAVIIPVLEHGAYDFFAGSETVMGNITFTVFIIALFAAALIAERRSSDSDEFIDDKRGML